MKMEQTECSETSAYKIQTPGNYPKESIQHTEHGESLKLRNFGFYKTRGISSLSEELLDFQGLCSMNLIYFDVTAILLSRGQSDIKCRQLNAVTLRSVGHFH